MAAGLMLVSSGAVALASPSNAEPQETCKNTAVFDPANGGSGNLDGDSGTASGEWGSLSWDSTSITYDLEEGFTLALCLKAGSDKTPDQGAAGGVATTEVNGSGTWDPTFGDGTHEADTSHIAYAVIDVPDEPEEIPVPAQPGVDDPCGEGNATWMVPEDTEVLDWELEEDGDLVVTIVAEDTVFEGTEDTMHNYGQAPETNTEECEVEGEEIELPAAPGVDDPCGAGNATWQVPEDTEVLDWELEEDGDLVVTIVAEDTVFEGTEDTMHNYGQAPETNTEECEVGGVQLEVPAEPKVKDPCGKDNAAWVVPADTEELDWTLADGNLSVEILTPDTTFEGTQDTTFDFGVAQETNTEACEVKGEEEEEPDNDTPTVEVKGEQATVPGSVNAGLSAPAVPQNAPRGLGLMLLGAGLALLAASVPHRRRTAARR